MGELVFISFTFAFYFILVSISFTNTKKWGK